MSKISEKQLEQLQTFVQGLNQIQSQLGQIEIEKHNFLHQAVEMQGGLQNFQKELEEEYGKVSINIQDGSFKEIQGKNESNS